MSCSPGYSSTPIILSCFLCAKLHSLDHFLAHARIVVAIFVSFVARMLNSIGGHIFCYSAISSSGVVLILPGFLVRTCLQSPISVEMSFMVMQPTSVQGSLELASKNFITGATKIVYAIIYSLILVSLFYSLDFSRLFH